MVVRVSATLRTADLVAPHGNRTGAGSPIGLDGGGGVDGATGEISLRDVLSGARADPIGWCWEGRVSGFRPISVPQSTAAVDEPLDSPLRWQLQAVVNYFWWVEWDKGVAAAAARCSPAPRDAVLPDCRTKNCPRRVSPTDDWIDKRARASAAVLLRSADLLYFTQIIIIKYILYIGITKGFRKILSREGQTWVKKKGSNTVRG